jgi:peptidoglycan biosynthesis protein MviN/MurJ (putative lipid II flippase)
VLNAGLLYWWLWREVGLLDGRRVLRSVLRMLPGLVAMAGVCWFGSEYLAQRLGTTRELAKLLTVLAPMAIGGVLYLGLCAALKVEELHSAVALVLRKRNAAVEEE